MEMPQILNIDRAADVQIVHGRRWFLIHEELVCVPEASDVRVTVAAILNEELTLNRRMWLMLLFGPTSPVGRRCEFRGCE